MIGFSRSLVKNLPPLFNWPLVYYIREDYMGFCFPVSNEFINKFLQVGLVI